MPSNDKKDEIMSQQPRNMVKSVMVRGKSRRIYYEYYDNDGKVRRRSTGLLDSKANRFKAKKAIPAFEQKLKEQSIAKKHHTLMYYAKLYVQNNQHLSKIKVYESRLKVMIDYFGGENVTPEEVTLLQLKSFFAQLPVERDTKKDWLVPLKGALDNAFDDGAISNNVARSFILPKQQRLSPKNKRIRPFSPEEVRLLLDTAQGTLKNYLGITIFTGMRPQEAIALTINDIDFEKKIIKIERAITKKKLKSTKTEKGARTIPLFSQAAPYLMEQIADAKSKHSIFLFSDEEGRHLDDIGDIRGKAPHPSSRHYGSEWYKLLHEVGLPRIDLRNTRHTFAVRVIETGKLSLRDLQKLLGHSTLEPIYENYAKWIDDDISHINREMDLLERKCG